MKPKLLNDKDPWLLAENIPDSDIFFFQIPFSSFISDSSFKFIRNYTKVLAIFKKFAMSFYFGEKDSYLVGDSILQALRQRPDFGQVVNQEIVRWSAKLIKFARYVSRLPLAKYSNNKLWQLYKRHDQIHTKLYSYGWLPVALDMFHSNLTNALKQYLRAICPGAEEVENAFVVLTAPTKKSIVAREREDFLRLYKKYGQELSRLSRARAKGKLSAGLKRDLEKHTKKWRHWGYIYAGNHPPFSFEHYFEQLLDLAVSKVDADKLLRQENAQLRLAKKKRASLLKKYRVNALHRRLFDVAGEFALTKLARRNAQLLVLYLLHNSLLPEISKRLGLRRFQIGFMLMQEVGRALAGKKVNKNVLRRRLTKCIYYSEKNYEHVFVGKQAEKLAKQARTSIDASVSEIKGQTAQPGFARGVVKIIIRASDMAKMNKGDILVSIATDPDVVPAMKKAAAIVTDQGGITAHAAIVSRELGIPCVIGTKIATQVLRDGDKVEVDATKGIIRKI